MNKDINYYLSLHYKIVLYLDDEQDWIAEIPMLDGCIADGKTQMEALETLETVKRLWLEVSLENNMQIPEPEVDYSTPSTN